MVTPHDHAPTRALPRSNGCFNLASITSHVTGLREPELCELGVVVYVWDSLELFSMTGVHVTQHIMCSAPDMMLSYCISVHFLFQIYFVAALRPDVIIMPGRRKRSRGPLTRKFVCPARRDRVRRDLALLRGDAEVRVRP